MPSKVFMICDAYESGMGHGLAQDGHSEVDFGDPEHAEAYKIGYAWIYDGISLFLSGMALGLTLGIALLSNRINNGRENKNQDCY